MTRLRVKYGPCAPLRFSSMLSRPATGTTRIAATRGDLPVAHGSLGILPFRHSCSSQFCFSQFILPEIIALR